MISSQGDELPWSPSARPQGANICLPGLWSHAFNVSRFSQDMPKEESIDERFKQVLTDPRFRTLRKKDRKIKIDSRFKGMFEKQFNGQCKIDKRGKRLEQPTEKTLKRFYQVSSDEDDGQDEGDSDQDEDQDEVAGVPAKPMSVATRKSNVLSEEAAEKITPIAGPSNDSKKKDITDLRGEFNDILSSSSDEESSEDENEEVEEIDHNWGELDKDAPRSDNLTNRLAVCNVDWDRIKAEDLFLLFHSFKKETGQVLSVKIYPSQFGKERMEEEKIRGPKELTDVVLSDDEEDSNFNRKLKNDDDVLDTEDSAISEKLRQYQINRLKYFYAVVECDSKDTAAVLYDQLNGMEYESSASALDVRVIPDDVDFDEDEPTQECYSLPTIGDYKPPNFITTALQQSKVRLTWDETDPERSKTFQRAFTDRDKCNDDLAVYLASSSGEETDSNYGDDIVIPESMNDEDKIEAYRNLMKSLDEENEKEDVDMEVTWNPEVEKIGEEIVEKKKMEEMSVFDRERAEKKSKKKVNKKEKSVMSRSKKSGEYSTADNDRDNNSSDESRDEEEARKSEEALKLLIMDEETDKKHFNYDDFIEDNKSKRKKRKKKSKDSQVYQDGFQFDSEDPRFSAIYSSHHYNIDQSSSHFKKTKAIEEVLLKKAKTSSSRSFEPPIEEPTRSTKSLFKKVKLKGGK